MGADGLPTSKLAGDSLTACEKIGSTATTIEEAKEDPKVRQTEPTSWWMKLMSIRSLREKANGTKQTSGWLGVI